MVMARVIKPPEAILQVERNRHGYLVSVDSFYGYDSEAGRLRDSSNVLISDYHRFPSLFEEELKKYPNHWIVYRRRPKLGMSSDIRKIIFNVVRRHNSRFRELSPA